MLPWGSFAGGVDADSIGSPVVVMSKLRGFYRPPAGERCATGTTLALCEFVQVT
ncbi:hypothetical protein GCM10009738_72680 [Kitasatospora viridis]